MKYRLTSKGFGTVEALIIIVVLLAVGFASWAMLHRSSKPKQVTTVKTSAPTKKTQVAADPTENGKYLVINEWDVRVALPTDFQGKTTYQVTPDETDPDSGLLLGGVNILVSSDMFTDNVCAKTDTNLGSSIESGAEYIRSDNSKPFNAARYKYSFKANILSNSTYSYHLDSVIPDCLGGAANAAKMQELQTALSGLVKA